jgi:hypothetical protein
MIPTTHDVLDELYWAATDVLHYSRKQGFQDHTNGMTAVEALEYIDSRARYACRYEPQGTYGYEQGALWLSATPELRFVVVAIGYATEDPA